MKKRPPFDRKVFVSFVFIFLGKRRGNQEKIKTNTHRSNDFDFFRERFLTHHLRAVHSEKEGVHADQKN